MNDALKITCSLGYGAEMHTLVPLTLHCSLIEKQHNCCLGLTQTSASLNGEKGMAEHYFSSVSLETHTYTCFK